jgi:hypothetical protein
MGGAALGLVATVGSARPVAESRVFPGAAGCGGRVRWLLMLLAVGMAGVSIWLLFGQREKPRGTSIGTETTEELPAYLKLKRGTLTVRVRGPDGKPPPLAEVGYEAHPKPLFYGTLDDGSRTLNDVPLGEITVLVQAPGFEPTRRRTRVEAGVTEEMSVILTPLPADRPR